MSNDPLNLLLDEVRSCSAHPRTVVLVAHGIVELIVNTLVKAKCQNGKRILDNSRQYPHSAKAVILNEIGLFGNEELQLLDRFRKLRNDAVHTAQFAVLNDRVLAVKGDWPFQLPHKQPADADQVNQNLVTLCLSILAQVWGRHIDDLSEIFKVPR